MSQDTTSTSVTPHHVPTNVDDGMRGDIHYLSPETEAAPVTVWLEGFVAGGTPDAVSGLRDGSLEPALARPVVLAALSGLGIQVSQGRNRTWTHIHAMLSTPHPHVYVGVLLDDEPSTRFLLGYQHGGTAEPDEVVAAVRATMTRLRSAVVAVPAAAPVPALRPFRAKEGMRSFAQLAARDGIAVEPDAALVIDKLQDAANVEARSISQGMRDGTLDVETAHERGEVGKRAWLVEAYRLVGGDVVKAVLGKDAVPSVPPPEAPGWPYWLRAAVAFGRTPAGRKVSFELLLSIQYLCRHGGHGAIDAAYRRLDVTALSEVAMITLLRTPYIARDRLSEWEPFRERVRAELFARGKPGDKILIGLGKSDEISNETEAAEVPEKSGTVR